MVKHRCDARLSKLPTKVDDFLRAIELACFKFTAVIVGLLSVSGTERIHQGSRQIRALCISLSRSR